MNHLLITVQLGEIILDQGDRLIRTAYYSHLDRMNRPVDVEFQLVASRGCKEELISQFPEDFAIVQGCIWQPTKTSPMQIICKSVFPTLPLTHINQLIVIGRASGNPTTFTRLTKLSIAVNPSGTTNEPTWFQLECWGDLASRAKSYEKGDQLAVCGRLLTEFWRENTTQCSKLKISVQNLIYLGSKELQQVA